MKQVNSAQLVVGWISVGISTAVTCFWAFWGIIENFHEGWYYNTLWANVAVMLVQYLSPMLIWIAITLTAVRWPHLGGILHGITAVAAIWFFNAFNNPGVFILIAPLLGLGALYWFGKPQTKKTAASIIVGLPLLVLVVSGIEPVLRVSQRIDDGIIEARLVPGNGIRLIWAPEGPGWPRSGADWDTAQHRCRHLSDDGARLEPEPGDIWRLPTVDEAVRSMARHGQNSGGQWYPADAQAIYAVRPDKESPLWDVHSPVIYWWTATEVDHDHAYIIVYDGRVWPRAKALKPDYLAFRCVKEPLASKRNRDDNQ